MELITLKQLEINCAIKIIDPPNLLCGSEELNTHQLGIILDQSKLTTEEYRAALHRAKEHVLTRGNFQIILRQQFEWHIIADRIEN